MYTLFRFYFFILKLTKSVSKSFSLTLPWIGLGARWLEVVAKLKSMFGKVSEQLKLGLLPTINEFWGNRDLS